MSSIDKMRELLAGATVSKFLTPEACQAFKDGVSQCIQIMEEENNSHKAEKGTGLCWCGNGTPYDRTI